MSHRLFLLCLILTGVGSIRAADVITIAGNGSRIYSGDGGLGTNAGIGGPFGVVVGPDGALYICETENHSVRRLDLKTNLITTVAGSGKAGYGGDGDLATKATCREPYEVRFDLRGDMYFVEMKNHIVRKVDAKSGRISTIAGTGRLGFSGDGGPAVQAQFNVPHSITLDHSGTVYIADIGNHRLRAVDLKSGLIRTISGTGKKDPTLDGAALEGSPLNGPRTLDFDGSHSLFLALREGNAVFRIDLESRTIHHLAGTGKSGYSGDGGSAKNAVLAGPKGIALGPNGDIYLADTESHTIRVVRKATGTIETVVGDGKPGDGPDGDPKKCRLNRPHGIFVDAKGTIYIGDSSNHKVRMYRPM